MIYIASPYWHKKKRVRRHRRKQAIRYSLALSQYGILNYCPLLYTSGIKDNMIPEEYWVQHGEKMVSFCSCVQVLCLDGWQESNGVDRELKVAEEHGLEVFYIDPGIMKWI